jgi:hypothetical protein
LKLRISCSLCKCPDISSLERGLDAATARITELEAAASRAAELEAVVSRLAELERRVSKLMSTNQPP